MNSFSTNFASSSLGETGAKTNVIITFLLVVVLTVKLPNPFVEANDAAVKMVDAIIVSQLVATSIELERGAADPIGATADGAPHVKGRSSIRTVGKRVGHCDATEKQHVLSQP